MLDHCRNTCQLGTAGRNEHESRQDRENPESDEAAIAGGRRSFARSCHKTPSASRDDSVLKAAFVPARCRSRELTDRFRIGDCGIQASSRYLVSVSSPAALAAKNPTALFPENGK